MAAQEVARLSVQYIVTLLGAGGIIGGVSQVLAKITLWYENTSIPPAGSGQSQNSSTTHEISNPEIKARKLWRAGAAGIGPPLFGFDDEIIVHLRFGAFVGLFLSGALIGLAGAGGVVGILVLIKVFDPDLIASVDPAKQLQFQLELFGISIIGGFIARRLLPILGENLVSRVHEHSRQLAQQRQANLQLREEIEQKAAKLEQESAGLRDENANLRDELVVERALSVLQSQSVEGWMESEREISHFLARHPSHRRATIFAARFATERPKADTREPDYRKAIDVLTRFLEQPAVSDFDYADVIYNRACYYSKLAELAASAAEKERLIRQALDDLTESVRRKPANKDEAINDEWLSGVSQEREFKLLVGQG